MRFHSILFREADGAIERLDREPPAFFHDLNLDRVLAAITVGREEYDLAPFFFAHVEDLDTIAYRQEVMRDIEGDNVMGVVKAFAQGMHVVRERLAQSKKARYPYQQERWLLGAVAAYCGAAEQLSRELSRPDVRSRGLRAFREYLADYVRSDTFTMLAAQARKLESDLSAIRYALLIHGNSIRVRSYKGETDYTTVVEHTFDRFRRGVASEYRFKLPSRVGMNHVEAQVLDGVARLNPETFRALHQFCTEHAAFQDGTVAAFDREIQFYVAYLDFVGALRRAGLSFCYPQVAEDRDEIRSSDGFDVALANELVRQGKPVVCNDFSLRAPERVFVVSGPNQGGKTTFARTFGQMHFLASLGCPVPGKEARLFLWDRLFTHFEKEEDIRNLRGKLQDELIRIRDILGEATPRSILIMNESFSATTLKDAIYLTKEVMARISALDLLCVCVTFLDEVASLNEKTVSVVSTVDLANPAVRTFKLVRRPADGLSYALAIAEKHRVTYRWLKERITA